MYTVKLNVLAVKVVTSKLSEIHSLPAAECKSHWQDSVVAISNLPDKQKTRAGPATIEIAVKPVLQGLARKTSLFPYYKYNQMWTREVQNVVRPAFLLLAPTAY